VGPAIAISVPRSAGSVIAELCQDIIAAAAEVRASVPLALEAMQTEHEADRTTSLTWTPPRRAPRSRWATH
jgi:hypothetical protein